MWLSIVLGLRSRVLWEGVVVEVVVWTGDIGCHIPTSVPFPKAWMALPVRGGGHDGNITWEQRLVSEEKCQKRGCDFKGIKSV